MRVSVLLSVLMCSLMANGQSIKLNKFKQIDTLRVTFEASIKIDAELKEDLDSIFRYQILKFNSESHSYLLMEDSINNGNSIRLYLDSINYVTTKRSILATGLDLALIAGHILMITSYSWTLPIYPFLVPGINGVVDLEIDPLLVSSNPKTILDIGPGGYFMKKEKQKEKYKRKFHKKLERLYSKIDKQNLRNKNRASHHLE